MTFSTAARMVANVYAPLYPESNHIGIPEASAGNNITTSLRTLAPRAARLVLFLCPLLASLKTNAQNRAERLGFSVVVEKVS